MVKGFRGSAERECMTHTRSPADPESRAALRITSGDDIFACNKADSVIIRRLYRYYIKYDETERRTYVLKLTYRVRIKNAQLHAQLHTHQLPLLYVSFISRSC